MAKHSLLLAQQCALAAAWHTTRGATHNALKATGAEAAQHSSVSCNPKAELRA